MGKISVGMYPHVEPGWRRLCQLTDMVHNVHGPSIHDYSSGKTWDCGQAICREAYGPDWNDSPEFAKANCAELAPPELIRAGERLVAGKPDWMEPPHD